MDDTSEAPIIKLVNHIISQSIKARASDIHIEPYQDSFKVRYRVDGTLRDVVRPRSALHAALISRIKIMANMDIAEKRLPQDGRLDIRIGAQDIDVRVSTIPTSFGERVVLRRRPGRVPGRPGLDFRDRLPLVPGSVAIASSGAKSRTTIRVRARDLPFDLSGNGKRGREG